MRRLPAAILVGLVVLVVGLALAAQLLYPSGQMDVSAAVVLTLAVASLAGVGGFLAIRVPENIVGWLLLVSGSTLAVAVFAGAYSIGGTADPAAPWPGVVYATWLSNDLFIVPIVICVAGVPAVFPDGHLPSRRWRWLAVLLIAGTTFAVLVPALTPGPLNESSMENPFGVAALEDWSPAATAVANVLAVPAFLGAWAALATRFRRGTSLERQQIKWLLAVVAVGAVAFPASFLFAATVVSDILFFFGFASIVGLPIAIGIAILRYRLYEIDRIVSRTIGWAVVTAILVVVFAAVVVGLQALLTPLTSENTLAVAASTLVAAALFQPLRGRVQRAVDRRFNRSRVDAQRAVDAFGSRLRDEVDLGSLRGGLLGAARDAVQPASAALWIRASTTPGVDVLRRGAPAS